MSRQHFVKFYSPGTLISETTSKPIESWDTKLAAAMATEISERHGARPYGFQFGTKLVADPVPDGEGGVLDVTPKVVETSGTHFITGELLFYHEVSPSKSTLRGNMRCNGWPICVQNTNSYRSTLPFEQGDCIVDREGVVIRRGADADLVAYCERMAAEWKAEREQSVA